MYFSSADSTGNLFPNPDVGTRDIADGDWGSLVQVCYDNGADLKPSATEQGIALVQYDTWDTDGDGNSGDDYYFLFTVNGVPNTLKGSLIEVRASGITKYTHP